ncbi:b(0,+)-type amino acid transporter 1-like [Physella acuta]|uniref:b(0,+)-type amino acid transporter 1-like n=1 Tax=Physella acuta TaxID=109671 RepID=UPI0027DB4E3B|nr:b(0,+)-type amino acid transporter 1-like [Physella acuta]XP_059164937.1 b(0,+)-type amino acid transporter 1-like [Physella acuta]XP_059164938.1 b(0,+)-type amino acid transporter 1-like [Physella acuta]XP_059164939.1 b(0,+)-type amino acid transporter 1-like [Physella acuta]
MKKSKYELGSPEQKVENGVLDHVEKPPEDEPEIEEGKMELRRELGLFGGISFIVGCIVGSGIFVSPKGVLDGTGSVGLSLIVWAGSGLISLCGSLCYCELGTMIPKSGAEYSYLRSAFGDYVGYLNIWVATILTRPASLAIMSLTFGAYFSTLFENCGQPEIPTKIAAIVCLVTIMLLNCYSTKLAARLQIITTVAKVAALFVIIIGGIYKMALGNTDVLATGFDESTTEPSTIALSFYDALWAYDGWNNLNFVTEELKNPAVNLPRANILSIIIVIIIYCMTNVCYLTAMTKAELLASDAVAMLWGDRVLMSAAIIMPLSVMISTLGSTNASAFSGGRSTFAAARDENLPEVLCFIHVRQLTPLTSMVFTLLIAIIFVLVGDISSLIDFFSFSAWVFYGLTFSTVLYFRWKKPNDPRPYRVPLVIPIVMILISIYLVIAPIVQDPRIEFLYATIFIFGGTIFYIPFVHFKKKAPFFDHVTTLLQLIFEVVPPSKYVD